MKLKTILVGIASLAVISTVGFINKSLSKKESVLKPSIGFEKYTEINSFVNFNGLQETLVKKNENISTNQLISSLLEKNEILGFNEKIPSFNDIFIKVVGEDANTILS